MSFVFKINRRKLKFQIVGYMSVAVLVFLSFFAWAKNQETIPPILLQASGMIGAMFLVIAAGAKGKKLNDTSAGLEVSQDGINDSTSEIGIGRVRWSDIKGVLVEESKRTGLLLIDVEKHEKYFRNAKNSAIERLLKQNVRLHGTPVVIDVSYLQAEMDEIIDAIDQMKR